MHQDSVSKSQLQVEKETTSGEESYNSKYNIKF